MFQRSSLSVMLYNDRYDPGLRSAIVSRIYRNERKPKQPVEPTDDQDF